MGETVKGGKYADADGKGFHDAWGNKVGSSENKAAVEAGAPEAEAPKKKAKRAKKAK
jgi:hypothetical protein